MPKRMQDLPAEYDAHQRTIAEGIGGRVRALREQRGLKQEQLRAQLEVINVFISRAKFSRIENGTALPDASELIGLRTVLEVSFEWLILGE